MNRLPQALNAFVERLDTPAPIVPADVMRDSIDRTQGFATEHSLDVRPHVKTRTCVEIGRRRVKAGAVGKSAGNVGEAELFRAWVGRRRERRGHRRPPRCGAGRRRATGGRDRGRLWSLSFREAS